MIEFGEKLRQLREEKGITQQTLADELYVTRQAVSRWECGARYPDLLMAKRIAEVFQVTLDELVSGEEWKRDVEEEAILSKPMPNLLQSALYGAALLAYLIMSFFGITALIPTKALEGMPAAQVSLLMITTYFGYWAAAIVLGAGLYWSLENRLTPRKVGAIMSSVYLLRLCSFAATYAEMRMSHYGSMGNGMWLQPLLSLAAIGIILRFYCSKKAVNPWWVYLVAACTFVEILLEIKIGFALYLNTGMIASFAVRTVHGAGRLGMAGLLLYQSRVLDQKRRMVGKEK